jgi:hypothetical protein
MSYQSSGISNYYLNMVANHESQFNEAMLSDDIFKALKVCRMMVSISFDFNALWEAYKFLNEAVLRDIDARYGIADGMEDLHKRALAMSEKEAALYAFWDLLMQKLHAKDAFIVKVHVVEEGRE